ncbi:MaoC family dehydratase [soil metagenome]
MAKVQTFSELQPYVGSELGVADWLTIDQPMIDQFGAVTRDQHWIHVDPERAKAEGGFGGTLAHGFLTLSLLTGMLKECMEVTGAKRWMNYGLDGVRFTNPVKAGQSVRLRLTLKSLEITSPGAAKLCCGCTLELQGSDRPALVADFRMIGYE